jgi:hypothetical protein
MRPSRSTKGLRSRQPGSSGMKFGGEASSTLTPSSSLRRATPRRSSSASGSKRTSMSSVARASRAARPWRPRSGTAWCPGAPLAPARARAPNALRVNRWPHARPLARSSRSGRRARCSAHGRLPERRMRAARTAAGQAGVDPDRAHGRPSAAFLKWVVVWWLWRGSRRRPWSRRRVGRAGCRRR